MPYNIAKWFLGFWNPLCSFAIDVFCISLQYAFRIYTVLNSVSKFEQQQIYYRKDLNRKENISSGSRRQEGMPQLGSPCKSKLQNSQVSHKFHIYDPPHITRLLKIYGGGSRGRQECAPPPSVQILSFSCSFQGNFVKQYVTLWVSTPFGKWWIRHWFTTQKVPILPPM